MLPGGWGSTLQWIWDLPGQVLESASGGPSEHQSPAELQGKTQFQQMPGVLGPAHSSITTAIPPQLPLSQTQQHSSVSRCHTPPQEVWPEAA